MVCLDLYFVVFYFFRVICCLLRDISGLEAEFVGYVFVCIYSCFMCLEVGVCI